MNEGSTMHPERRQALDLIAALVKRMTPVDSYVGSVYLPAVQALQQAAREILAAPPAPNSDHG